MGWAERTGRPAWREAARYLAARPVQIAISRQSTRTVAANRSTAGHTKPATSAAIASMQPIALIEARVKTG
jgi:hypothetical protein